MNVWRTELYTIQKYDPVCPTQDGYVDGQKYVPLIAAKPCTRWTYLCSGATWQLFVQSYALPVSVETCNFGFCRLMATMFTGKVPRAVFTVVVRQEEFGVATDVGVTKVAAKVVGATMHAMVMASRIRILGIEKA